MTQEFKDNPATVLREMLEDPEIKRAICRRLGVPEDAELDEEALQQAEAFCEEPYFGPVRYLGMTENGTEYTP